MPDTWQDRYRITSVRGLIWTRAMVHRHAMRWLRVLSYSVGAERRSAMVGAVLDDVDVMRPMTGMVPSAVAREVGYEANRRLRRED